MDNPEDALLLRAARESDALAVWRWRNDQRVRNVSFNTRPIPWRKHKEWFLTRINDPASRIYIASLRGRRIGVVRFDMGAASVKVSVNLNPAFFGRGLGSEVIRRGTERFLRKHKTGKPIIAEVKKGNIASEKVFVKLGYRLKKSGRTATIYER